MDTGSNSRTRSGVVMTVWGWAASTVALAFTILMITPLAPAMPFPGIDGSWSHAMNVATAAHLRFGSDIIFTFGPLASVYTRVYHPGTDWMMLAGSLLVALALFTGFFAVLEPRRRIVLLLLPIVLSLGWSRDPIYLFLPVLLPLVVARGIEWNRTATLAVCLLSAAMAVLLVVKGNFGVLMGLATIISVSLCWPGTRRTALLIVAVQVASLVMAWLLAGQTLSDLPGYFIAQLPIISGYTDAMSVTGGVRDIVAFIVIAALLVAWSVLSGLRRYWYAHLMIAAYLFVAFKSGFVRHDGHATAAAVALVFVGLLLCSMQTRRIGAIAFVAALLGWGVISTRHMDVGWSSSTARFAEMIRSPVIGLWGRLTQPDVLPAQFKAIVTSYGQRPPFAGYIGEADVYPVDLASLLGSGAVWKPRPILQSYSVYTPGLARANAAHLESQLPSRIYFTTDPIDHRYPPLEDGASWLSLLGSYTPKALDGGYAVLERGTSGSAALRPGDAVQVQARLGEEVAVTEWENPVWATMDIRPTLLGKLFSTVFKAPKLSVRVRYANGESADFRMIAGMTSSGFLLSPTVTDAKDFVSLRSRYRQDMLDRRRVVAFTIYGDSGTRYLWDLDYRISLAGLDIPAVADADQALAGVWEAGLSQSSYGQGGDCNIDEVDRRQVSASAVDVATGMLTIRGWAALDGKNGVLAERVTLLVNGSDASAWQIPVHRVSRPDVAAHFSQPGLEFAGYEAYVDARKLPTDAQVRVLQRGNGQEVLCGTAVLTLHRTDDVATASEG